MQGEGCPDQQYPDGGKQEEMMIARLRADNRRLREQLLWEQYKVRSTEASLRASRNYELRRPKGYLPLAGE